MKKWELNDDIPVEVAVELISCSGALRECSGKTGCQGNIRNLRN